MLRKKTRLIAADTETTSLDVEKGKIVEIGAVEIEDGIPTGKYFHYYLNPDGIKMDLESSEVCGIYDHMLIGKPKFCDIIDHWLEFIQDSPLIFHNAPFDMKFLSKEFEVCNRPMFNNQIIDTLEMARQKYPGQRCSLDAICDRLKISREIRKETGHGALLDAKILAKVYSLLLPQLLVEELFFMEQKVIIDYEVNFDKFQPRSFSYVKEEERQNHIKIVDRIK